MSRRKAKKERGTPPTLHHKTRKRIKPAYRISRKYPTIWIKIKTTKPETMSKKEKVLSADYRKSFNGSRGDQMHVHFIRFESGLEGEYLSKSNPQNKFIPGEEAFFSVEEAMSKQGRPYNRIKPAQDPNARPSYGGGRSGGGSRSFIDDQDKNRLIVAQSSMQRAVELACSGKLDPKKIATFAATIYEKTLDISGVDLSKYDNQ